METEFWQVETKLKQLLIDYYTLKLERLKTNTDEKIQEELLALIKAVRSETEKKN